MKSNTRPLLCALLFLIKSADAAPSLILSDQPGWNGWSVQTRIKAGYREHGGAGEDAITDTQNTNISPFAVTAGSVISTPAASASKLPASGSAKDKAEGSLSFNYIVGGAATTDTFSVNMHATTSAMTSKHNFGGGLVAADAFVEGELVLTTYWPLTGAMLRIPAMPALTAAAPSTESMLALMDGGGAAGYMLPGFAELDYPLTLSAPPRINSVHLYSDLFHRHALRCRSSRELSFERCCQRSGTACATTSQCGGGICEAGNAGRETEQARL